MKAIIKAYSYKWFSLESQLDKEIGNGTIMYALTGLIPEYVSFTNFEKDGLPMLRNLLTDDMYFGNKAFVTCYCDESFRPKLPSVIEQNLSSSKEPTQRDRSSDITDLYSDSKASSPSKILNKLKEAAAMAISVTVGRKIEPKKNPNASNVIPGFGYSILDVFENHYVDMDSISNSKVTIEESKSPFKSPSKEKKKGPSGGFGITIHEASEHSPSPVKVRRDTSKERMSIIEEKELAPPKQYKLVQIKTAVTRYPAINCVSPFTNEEILEGKRCLLNHYKRTPEAEANRRRLIAHSISPPKRKKRLNVHDD
jgi:hypothetical protein